MPRLVPRLLRKANQASPHLATLLPACRDLSSARNELRWLTEFVAASKTPAARRDTRLAQLCAKRGRGVPLQYILGCQPFGPLDIKCKPGVLIPRPETEAYTYHLAQLIKSRPALAGGKRELQVVDFCTGTGCIPLLLFELLRRSFSRLHVHGVDISPRAVRLSKENIAHNVAAGNLREPAAEQTLTITQADVFDSSEVQSFVSRTGTCDVLISNPPYISEDVWKYGRGQIGYSVKKFEPSLALVPNQRLQAPSGWSAADVFYARLLDIAVLLRASVVLLEVGDEMQACRVLTGFSRHSLAKVSHVQVWRDCPDIPPSGCPGSLTVTKQDGQNWSVPTVGTGNVRSILIEVSKAAAMD